MKVTCRVAVYFTAALASFPFGGRAVCAAPPATAVVPSAPRDPLLDAAAYSLAVRPEGRQTADYFPLGVLFPRDTDELVSYGFDFTEQAVGPMFNPNGTAFTLDWLVTRDRPLPPPPPGDHLGLFVASWAWHLIPKDGKAGAFGPFGANPSYFDPAVRDYLLAADTALARRYGATAQPALMWSLDNEWEGQLDSTLPAVDGFRTYLRATYPTLAALNVAWGTAYADWSAALPPQPEAVVSRPAAWLDWHAFQDGYFTRLTADRLRAVYAGDPRHRPVAYKMTQQSFALQTVGKKRVLDPALLADLTRPLGGWYGADIYGADDALLYDVSFAAQCIRPVAAGDASGKLFLTEVNNHGGPGWQWANSLWRTLGSGVKAYDLFCFGMPGGTDDNDVYGMTAPDGTLRAKAAYAARFAYSIRRVESFWARSKPASDVPRIALLLNRPDILVADDVPGEMWTGPKDSGAAVYSLLRALGYWVDVIPYTKLDAGFLARYDALILVDARHLSPAQGKAVDAYVARGGKLLADRGAGRYDLHHREAQSLADTLGLPFGLNNEAARLAGAEPEPSPTEPKADCFRHAVGKGAAVYADFELGAMPGKMRESRRLWLRGALSRLGVRSAYDVASPETSLPTLRVEAPVVADGNAALVVASVGEAGSAPTTLHVAMPTGDWRYALWSPAESAALISVPVRAEPGRRDGHENRIAVDLPAITTGGTLLLLPNHAPLIAVDEIATARRGVDGHLPTLTPGAPVTVTGEIINPSGVAAPAGTLRVRALTGWMVSPAAQATPALKPHESRRFAVTVTPPVTGVLPAQERMYPLNFRWSDGAADRAVTTTPVGIAIDPARCPTLLTDNATYPKTFARQLHTGATYSYPGAGATQTVADPATGTGKPNSTLQDGTSRWTMTTETAHFHLPAADAKATILFDLKAPYPLDSVRLLGGGSPGFPTAMDVSISDDGKNYRPVGHAAPPDTLGSPPWLDLQGLRGKTARYVRLDVGFPNGDGYLNEVEIWGYRPN